MPNLRDVFDVNNTLSGLQRDQLKAADMGDLRRGWEAGRIGTEANAALADLASARADGDGARAAELDAQVKSLRQRQSLYAPQVGRVEDISGVGSALDWAQGQVGQGAASMLDPVAAAALAAGAGTALSAVPTAPTRLIGGGLRTLGAFAAPMAVNQQQLKGEAYGNMLEDPEVMAARTPQELNRTANMIGLGNAALDSVVPGIIGRGLGGAGLRAGLSSVGPGAKTLGGMALEGLTETGQGEVNRQVLGAINPNRDTSGDMSDRLNEFAGGAIGAGPFTAAGAYSDAGYRRLGATADVVSEKAGQMVDLAQPYVRDGVQKAGEVAGKVRDKVIDLAAGDDGKVTASSLKDNLKAASQELQSKWQATQDERNLILGLPPEDIANGDDPLAMDEWTATNYPKRRDAIIERLGVMAETDEQAGALYDALAGAQDQASQSKAVEDAAEYIISRTEFGQLQKQAMRFGDVAAQGGKAAGKAAVWAARKAGTAAKSFGQAVWDGMQEGSKKNAQWTGAEADAEFAQRRAVRDEAIKNADRKSVV